jgi:plastocyanin
MVHDSMSLATTAGSTTIAPAKTVTIAWGIPNARRSVIAAASFSATINKGDSVNWVWADAYPHTVTSGSGSPDGQFNSGQPATNSTFLFTFNNAGQFMYYCAVHPAGMKGTITVVGSFLEYGLETGFE